MGEEEEEEEKEEQEATVMAMADSPSQRAGCMGVFSASPSLLERKGTG